MTLKGNEMKAMTTQIHQNQPIARAGKSLSEASKVLLLLHGRGATAQSILPLAGELEASDFAVLAPQASGNAWYPKRFIAPKEQNEPYLSSALAMISSVVQKLKDGGIGTEGLVIGGFSQGACLAAEYVAQNPQRYGGLLVFSGGLIGMGPTVFGSLYKGSLAGTPVFMGCSDVDFHIPVDRFEKSGQILSDLGADVNLKVYPNMEHTIIFDEIEQAKQMLKSDASEFTLFSE